MTPPPAAPSIFHITHVQNLPGIVAAGGLWSDAAMIRLGGPSAAIGMNKIKQRRLGLAVPPHPGTSVGDYVPFYFCPRSVMLYLLHRGNHADLAYAGGQRPIVHVEADLHAVVTAAQANKQRWAFSLSNAGAFYTTFRASLADLGQIDWAAVAERDFRDPSVKEGKQAEFLFHDFFPWTLVRSIGVIDAAMAGTVAKAIAGSAHRPPVTVQPNWYY